MESLAYIIKQSIQEINTRNLIYKSPFEDRFTNELVRELNLNSPYFCVEQFPIMLGNKTRNSKIDIVGFDKKANHIEIQNLEIEYPNDKKSWGLEAKLYSPFFRLSNIDKYKEWSLGGPIKDFEKLHKDFDHFVILLIQDDIDNYDGMEEEDFKILSKTYNIFNLINSNFDVAKKQLQLVKEENRVSECFEFAKVKFDSLAEGNNYSYLSESGFICKSLIQKANKCPLKIHFMINEFWK